MSAEKTYKRGSGFLRETVNTFISLIKILLRSKFGVKLPQTKEQTCIVLGNGPSFRQSLEKHSGFLKQYPIICVNNFAVSEQYTEFKPTYYVMLDPGYWFGNNDAVINNIEAIRTKTTWSVHLFVPQIAKKSERLSLLEKQNPNIHICYFNYTVFKGFSGIARWLYSKNLAAPQSQNVLVVSLFLGLNCGFKKIYLLGGDHTWHQNLYVNDDNVLCVKNVHFYENEEKVDYKPFYKGAHMKEVFKINEIFNLFSKTFYGYEVINEYAEYCKANIYNASEISFIDAFKRIKL